MSQQSPYGVHLFQLVAIFEEDRRGGSESPRDSISNGFSSDGASPEAMHYYPHLEYDDPNRGEIEVNEAILKASMLHRFLTSTPNDLK